MIAALVISFLFAPGLLAQAADGQLSRLQSEMNVGLAALEEGNLEEARRRFENVRRAAPAEPLGWANGAVAALRSKDLARAQELSAEALRRAPNDARLLAIEGVRRELAGDAAGAAGYFERAFAADPSEIASGWSAARLLSQKVPAGAARALKALEATLERAPANLFLLARLAERHRTAGDSRAALEAHDRLARAIGSADPKLERYLAEARAALAAGDAKTASLKYRVVENVLRVTPVYQQARQQVEPGVVGIPLEEWTPALAARIRARAGRPIAVTFAAAPAGGLSSLQNLSAVRAYGHTGNDLVFAGPTGLVVAERQPSGYRPGSALAGSYTAVAVADLVNSGRFDLAAPGALWLSERAGFRKLPAPDGVAVTPLDYDNDGDLDLFFSSPGGDRLMRNNLDGTWADTTRAAGVPDGLSSRGAGAGDLDRDGDPDLIVCAAGGGLVLLDNLRGGRFRKKDVDLPTAGTALSVVTGDFDADGRLDVVWGEESAAHFARNRGDGRYAPAARLPAGGAPVAADFDNDGFLDLLLASPAATTLLRGDGTGAFAPWPVGSLPGARDSEAVDLDSDGDLDVALVTASGTAALFENRGGNANGWVDVVLQGLATGSGKVNRAGYGSEVELKAQDLYVYRVVSRPVTRLGLGARRRAEVLRVVWTNGIPQNEVSPRTKAVLTEVQQLKGSCPFVYAFDGARWRFVTDALGRSPLGLLYDGVHQAPADTREWLRVRGSELAPSNGRLLLDLTEELWEVAYIDLAELVAVDHAPGVEIVPDEKMVPPPFPEKRLRTVVRPRVPRATDGSGRDRTREIAREDGKYLGGFRPTRYQGIVEPHDLVLDLAVARRAKEIVLYLTGWIFYSDTSIQVSLSQQGSGTARPNGPVLEIPDGRGGWKVAIAAMGYPAGKTKTMAVDLSSVLDRRDPRVRIRTNLAIYWDRIVYTSDDPEPRLEVSPAPLAGAQLSYRGFSTRVREGLEAPHVFVHDEVDRRPRWADLVGSYTAYGGVRGLLTEVDDRYVVMKGGDSIRLEFDATDLPPLPTGWVRDWLLVLDGWDKDGDENTVAGQTVEPLPFHGQDDARYGEPQKEPPALEELRRRWLTRREGPDAFRSWVRTLPSTVAP